MSKMLFDFRLSCTIFHVTFFNSDHFFRTLVVKILIFIQKKSVYLEFQLCFFCENLAKSRKKKKKVKKGLGLKGDWTWVSQVRVRYRYPETTEEVIITNEFTWTYIREDEISIVYKTMKFWDATKIFNWILKFWPKHQ